MRKSGLAGLFVLVGAGLTMNCSSGGSGESVSSSQAADSRGSEADKGGDHDRDDRDHDQDHHEDESCSISKEGPSAFNLTFAETHEVDGGHLSLTRTFKVDETTGDFLATSRLALNDHPILLSSVDTKVDHSFHATFDYGRSISGPRHVDVTSSDGKTATAVVDGKPTLAFPVDKGGAPPRVRFENGKPVPANDLSDELGEDVRKLAGDVAREFEPCLKDKVAAAAATFGVPSSTVALALQPAAAAMSLTQTPVGPIQGINNGLCLSAQFGVGVAWGGCVSGGATASLGCSDWVWACVVGTLVVCTGIAIGGSALVSNSSICCPVNCDPGEFEPFCCETNQQCLDSPVPLCCNNGAACGSECCAPGIKCVGGGTCCKPGAECGNTCCDDGKGLGGVCIDATTGTCCMAPSVRCFTSACCNPTDICTPGDHGQGVCTPGPVTCPPGVQACPPDNNPANCPASSMFASVCEGGCCTLAPK